MRHLIRPLLGATVLASFVVVNTADSASATPSPSGRVVYCETNVVNGQQVTSVDFANGYDNLRIVNLTMRNAPFEGRRHLVESPVAHGPRVMHCAVTTVNGKRAMVLTTVGGAEWLIFRPAVLR